MSHRRSHSAPKNLAYISDNENKQPSKYGRVPQPIIHQTNPNTFQFNLALSRAATKIENSLNQSRSVPFFVPMMVSNGTQVYQSFDGNYYQDYQRRPSIIIRPRSNSVGLILPQHIAEMTPQRKDFVVFTTPPQSKAKPQTYKSKQRQFLNKKRGKQTILGYLGTMSPSDKYRLRLKIDRQGDSKIGACCWAPSINPSKLFA